jgi:DNA mismatch repair protein MutS
MNEASKSDNSPAKAGSVPTADPAATPMMRQFVEIKSANPDSLLFYRMGDFYELFFDDAVQASRALGITLTKRGKHAGQDIPMCGVPVHAADDYLQKLIGLGFRVAVCEQTEDPAEAKKRGSKSVVRRDVVRLVTPGTVTEDKLLDPRENAWLASLARIKSGSGNELGEMALARIDLSTGNFEVLGTNAERLMTDLASFAPREIVLADNLFADEEFAFLRDQIEESGCALTPEPVSMFDSSAAGRRLMEFYEIGALDAFGAFSRAHLAAAAAALGYVCKTQVAARPSLERPRLVASEENLGLDLATRTSLELTRTIAGDKRGSLLAAIDRTVTPAGGRLLAEHLRAPLRQPDQIDRRLDGVSWFVSHDRWREELRTKLRAVPDLARATSRLALDRGGPRDLVAILQGITSCRDISQWLSPAKEGELDGTLPEILNQAISALAALPKAVQDDLSSALADDVPMLARDGGFIRQGYSEELDELRALRDESRKVIAGLQTSYAEQTGVKALKIKYNNVLGYFIEVTAQNASALMDEDEAKGTYIHRQTLANAMRFTTTELADLESRIASAAGRATQIELGFFRQLSDLVLSIADNLRAASDKIAALDVASANAELALEQGYCRPQIDDSLAFDIVAGRHPVVEQALRKQAANPFVSNDCDLSAPDDEDAGSVWLLTGPNMGGKSTFLRQNALIVILAQMGSFVPAGSAHIGVVDRIFSRVGAADDLARGRSTFMVEMVETAAILNQATEKSFVILDEIGRGTATYDGLSIAWATLESLHEQNRSRAIFATHYHELTALAAVHDRLSNVTMAVREWEGDVVFLHEVREGAADRSYGIQVARLAGLPEGVVARARDVLEQLESSETNKSASTLIDDLPLFSVSAKQEHKAQTSDSEVILRAEIEALMPDELSPRDALDALYKLKAKLAQS